jgi:hypothetical protein
MRPEIIRLIGKIRDAGVTAEAWPDALKALTEAMGVAGAACIVSNKITGQVDWVCFSGLSAEFESSYLDHFAPLDPYTPLLNVERGWTKLSETLPDTILGKSEWYNDFVLSCGVRDILGARIVETPSHFATVGLHQQLGRRFGDKSAAIAESVARPLRLAMSQRINHLFVPNADGNESETAAEATAYFFHVVNGKQYPDEIGKAFASDQEAVAHAALLATELAQDRDWDGFTIVVADGDDRIIARVPVWPVT